MRKILFVINEYAPDFSANSLCVKNVITELIENHNYAIDVLTFTGDYELATLEASKELNIHRIKCPLLYDNKKVYQKSKMLKDLDLNCLYKRIRNRFIITFIWPSFTFFYFRKMKQKLHELINNNQYASVITSSVDFLPQLAGLWLKKEYPHIKWISYFNDPMPVDNFLFNCFIKSIHNLYNKQRMIFKNADMILVDEILGINYCTVYSKFRKKIFCTGIPTVKNIYKIDQSTRSDEYKNIVYAGALYKDMRNPEYVLKLFVRSKLPIRLHIFGSGNCDHILAKYSELSCGKIVYHGQVKQSVVKEHIQKSDYLLNIGNLATHQVPSKLYEYISTGLPIINIVKSESDPVIKKIETYTNGINIFESHSLENSLNSLEKFCSLPHKIIPFCEVKKNFYKNTPENTAEIISEFSR